MHQTSDIEWLKTRYYDKLVKYIDYWFSEEYDSNHNGLPVWNSADHTGMDNQDERAGAIDSYVCEGVELSVFLVREMEAMAKIASFLKKENDRVSYLKRSETLKDKIKSYFWDDKDGFFYDVNVRTGEFIKCKTVAGFSPLWIGAATEKQASRLINEHLTNTREFWLEYPIASMSKLEPGYRQDKYDYETCCNWKGTTWIPSNYYVFHGLIRYGYDDIAKTIADKTFEMLIKNSDTREYYNGQTGGGLGLKPFWGWSILGYFMPLEYKLKYSPANMEASEIMPYANTRGK